MPFALGTPFNIYYPYWNSNVLPSQPPLPAPASWMVNPNWPASLMVFAASGVFADNIQQAYYDLPSQVPPPTSSYPSVPPASTPAYVWQSLLATLENMLASALVRGIAAPIGGEPPLAPLNWASQPQQIGPDLSASSSLLTPNMTYYYVVTTVNSAGESAASIEFSAQPTTALPSVQVNWLALPAGQAASFNVYRGTAPGQENTLVANVPNPSSKPATSAIDGGGGTSRQPPRYYPAGAVSDCFAKFFHHPAVSIAGAAYAYPYDDQGNQSSTQSGQAQSLLIAVGPWTPASGVAGARRNRG